MSTVPYIADRNLVVRVRKYLETNVHKTFIEIKSIADDLQATYREYARLKRNSFRTSVKKAYEIVLQHYSNPVPNTSDDDDESDEESHAHEQTNFDNLQNPLSATLNDIYRRQPKKIDENELIDISSDDSEAPVQTSEADKAGASTSHNNNKRPFHEGPGAASGNGSSFKKRKMELPQLGNSRRKKSLAILHEPSVSFRDIGGLDRVLEDICQLLVHVKHPEVYRRIGISPPRGFLLHGPPGCGKTLLANAIAGEIGVPLLKVAAPELVAGVSGESEERIRELFERATLSTPCILFIDEIDAITPNRQNAQKEMERRIVAQLLTCLDDLNENDTGDRVLVIGATNRPDSIDPALRRAGRFDREICLGIPNAEARMAILKILTAKLQLEANFDYNGLAMVTPGFVGADLMSLTREAAMTAVNRMFNTIKHTQQQPISESIVYQLLSTPKQNPLTSESVHSETIETQPSKPDSTDIIVLDDKPTTSDTSLEVIDVETSKTPSPSPKHQENGVEQPQAQPSLEPPAPSTALLPTPPLTRLEELICWLHNRSPLKPTDLEKLSIEMSDFAIALKCVQPSSKREGFITVPDVTWADIGSLSSVREELEMAILAPIQNAKQFAELGLETPTGVMLCGPPGCGKTLVAKAIANEAGINFISVKGPEMLNMYVGESERAVRVCFERARNSAPCVIFFDELDALCPKRSDAREGGATMRVVNQMLTEMDGMGGRVGVYLLAATNRPDIIDPAVLRPGRFDKILYVGLPTGPERVDILGAITKGGTRPRLEAGVDLEAFGSSEQCKGYTGADLAALVREASMVALKEFLKGGREGEVVVKMEHFAVAVAKIRPSVSEKDRRHYEKLRKLYACAPGENDVEEMEYS